MSDNKNNASDLADKREPCTVCGATLSSTHALKNHMVRWHPTEWENQCHGGPITYLPCSVPGCDQLNNNARPDHYNDHRSVFHGIDIPPKVRTRDFAYLKRKRDEVLKQHILEEATELNELNQKIRRLECELNLGPPAVYRSCHRFDVHTFFATDLDGLPGKKADFVHYLQHIRTVRSQVGSLYTKPGVMDTRDGVLDDLETLMGWP